jgi:hypothetical protein
LLQFGLHRLTGVLEGLHLVDGLLQLAPGKQARDP